MTSETAREQLRRRPVLVGVDGSAAALYAVEWAAAEAHARGAPLRIVHAIDPDEAAGAFPLASGRGSAGVRCFIGDAVARAAAVSPRLDIGTDVATSSPVAALIGEEPDLVCVGTSGAAPAHPGHRASIVTELLLAAPCAVTIVRSAPRSGWVVAEVLPEPGAAEVLHTALAEAALRAEPLRIVCGSGAAMRSRVLRQVHRWRDRDPGLDVVVASEAWTLDQFLDRYRNQVGLFVAPSRYLHEVGTVLHDAAAAALEKLDCPVMVCGVDRGAVRRNAHLDREAAPGDIAPTAVSP